jgi:hypothetical protein
MRTVEEVEDPIFFDGVALAYLCPWLLIPAQDG